MIKEIVYSVEKYIKNNINVYTYSDTSIDVNRSFLCSPESDILSTDTIFTPVSEYGFPILSDDGDYLLYNTIRYTGEEIIERKIISYDNTTGEVEIDSPFGVGILTADSFNIEISNSVFVYEGNSYVNSSRMTNLENVIPITLKINTKNDGNRVSLSRITDDIRQQYYSDSRIIEIYDLEDNLLTDSRGDNITVETTTQSGESLQTNIMIFVIKYYENFK